MNPTKITHLKYFKIPIVTLFISISLPLLKELRGLTPQYSSKTSLVTPDMSKGTVQDPIIRTITGNPDGTNATENRNSEQTNTFNSPGTTKPVVDSPKLREVAAPVHRAAECQAAVPGAPATHANQT